MGYTQHKIEISADLHSHNSWEDTRDELVWEAMKIEILAVVTEYKRHLPNRLEHFGLESLSSEGFVPR